MLYLLLEADNCLQCCYLLLVYTLACLSKVGIRFVYATLFPHWVLDLLWNTSAAWPWFLFRCCWSSRTSIPPLHNSMLYLVHPIYTIRKQTSWYIATFIGALHCLSFGVHRTLQCSHNVSGILHFFNECLPLIELFKAVWWRDQLPPPASSLLNLNIFTAFLF